MQKSFNPKHPGHLEHNEKTKPKDNRQVTYKGRPIRIAEHFSPETIKSWGRCHTDPKRRQIPTQATIASKTLSYHRWRNQDIP